MAMVSTSSTSCFHRQHSSDGDLKIAHLATGKAAEFEAATWSPQGKNSRVNHAREGWWVPKGVEKGVGNESLCCLLRPAQNAPR